MTTIFTDRHGKISVVRSSLFFVGLGILIMIASYVYVAVETQTARSPLELPRPDGAQDWYVMSFGDRPIQRTFYTVPTTDIDSVVNYYQNHAQQFGAEPCTRFPPTGNYAGYDPDENAIPFEWKCLFERANLPGVSQSTLVIIQPGVKYEEPPIDLEGQTVIEYEQRWHE